ncbi:MAG: UvrD-helicase domain-containing protein [Aquabacterium sp.]|nr:UvrD-helicase domain-containing protein [Aquabacterium sp.]
MSRAAYEINGKQVDSALFYQTACDPHRSVVVEACAGAGKTWMLVSRILRAMLDGVPPNQILAITFTKKAAGEMRERLHDWLRTFSLATDAERETELQARGVLPEQMSDLIPRLQGLYPQWLETGQGVAIHTIHGWFSKLVKAAPLDVLNELGLPPELNLIEDTSEVWPELWGRFLKRLDVLEADAPELLAFMSVVRAVGRFNAEAWLQTALSNRLELTLSDQAGHLISGVESVGAWSPQWADLAHPTDALQRDSVRDQLWSVARQLVAAKGSIAPAAGVAIEQALGLPCSHQQAMALCAALLTQSGEPRKRMGDSPDLAWAQSWLMDLLQATLQHEAHELHEQMVVLSRLLFVTYAKLKMERGLADMVDLELAAARLLADPVLSGWIQQRLDSQVKQLLMDEFQDTSPLQWQTLKAWLSGYAGAGGGGSGQTPIQVFLVGDPKQSIYRFRRADPRVFGAAKAFVLAALDGDLLACDHTRRNAHGVVSALNMVMGRAHDEGVFPGFRAHTTASQADARIRALPSIMRAEASKPTSHEGWRDSLTSPRELARTTIKELEAAQVAAAVKALIVQEGIVPSDIFVLSRKRATLALVAQALDERGVAHIAPENTLLIDTAEVRDLVAVLDVLVSPHHDMALAHALKSPLFGASDADLLYLAHRVRQSSSNPSWYDVLTGPRDGIDEAAPAPAPWPASLDRAAQLLMAWAQLSKVAPPHDLLERVVSEGQYRERLLACVPYSRRAQALFHVDALQAQSLEMDSGRDATPYRWVRAIKRLPLNLPPRAQSDAVQLLTIHGAKGLEARVVFMVDSDPEPAKKDSYAIMVDWPESHSEPKRCAFLRSEGKPPPSLAQALADDRAADQLEELNAMYVALTRAREQLIFSRTEPRGLTSNSWWQRLASCGVIDPAQSWVPCGSPPDKSVQVPDAILRTLPSLCQRTAPTSLSTAPRASDQTSYLQQLGQVVHRALEWLTMLPVVSRTDERIARAASGAARELQLDAEKVREAIDLVTVVLRSPVLQEWLDPAQLVWAGNEVGLDDKGQMLRIDRLVARETTQGTEWWVIDYKLHHRPELLDSYQQQMARYVSAVSALEGHGRVHAAFITGAGEWVPVA